MGTRRAGSAWVHAVTALGVLALTLFAGAQPVSAAPVGQQCATPTDTIYPGVPWAVQRLAPQRVWPLTDGHGVVVAVIDTGVDGAVPQLAGHVLRGYDVVNAEGVAADDDCYGHGTFVAGIIAASRIDGSGVVGIAPGVTILPIRQANGLSDGTASGLARGVQAAVDAGADVINISASSFFPSEPLRQAIDYASAHDVVVVAAAANRAQSGNPVPYPAGYPSVVAVGAVGPGGTRTDFSETGDYLDLVAPGADVIGLSRGGRGHLVGSGTSYATPFVAATAALVRAYHPHLTAAQVKRRLELTADHPATSLPDPQLGWGMVNPYHAVTAILPEEDGASPARQPLPPLAEVAVPTPDTRTRDVALGMVLAGVVVSAAGGLLVYLLPLGMKRGWRGEDGRP
jgi:membrane-anchored mycosin MYCP